MFGISAFTPLYLLAIYGSVRYLFRPKEELGRGKVNWSPLESVGITLAIYFIAQIIGSLMVYGAVRLIGWDDKRVVSWLDHSTLGQFLLVASIEILSLGLLWIFLRRRHASLETIGLRRRPQWTDLSYILLGFAAYFILYAVVTGVVQHIFPSLNVNQQQQVGFDNARQLQLVLVFLSLVIFPPVVEELLVRGFLYTGLRSKLPKPAAVIITSGLFAVAHLQAGSGKSLLWIAAIDTFVLSLVLIYLREKTNSLWASIGLHMLKNGIAFLSLFVLHIL